MKPASHIQAAIELLALIEERFAQPADQICAEYYKARRYIGSTDRREIARLVYGILRHRNSCDWWALNRGQEPSNLAPHQAARVRALGYLWLHQKTPRAQLGMLFSDDPYGPEKLNSKERVLLEIEVDPTPQSPWIEGEYPQWIHERLSNLYGDQVVPVMQAFLKEAPVDLRVNTLKTTRYDLMKILKKEGIETKPLETSENGLRCLRRLPLSGLASFKQGLFEVQDAGSQILAQKVEAAPGMAVLDFCAGAGGKTLSLAAAMENKGRLVATDTAEWRLKRAKERLKRGGVHNAETRVIEPTSDQWLKRQKGKFDRVLVDAPCSGTGTWRRNPDQKWRLHPEDIGELATLQLDILTKASALVKPGGRLIYGTCSILKEENEDVIAKFLETSKDYVLHSPMVRLDPFTTQTDGFFVCVLEKTHDETAK